MSTPLDDKDLILDHKTMISITRLENGWQPFKNVATFMTKMSFSLEKIENFQSKRAS